MTRIGLLSKKGVFYNRQGIGQIFLTLERETGDAFLGRICAFAEGKAQFLARQLTP